MTASRPSGDRVKQRYGRMAGYDFAAIEAKWQAYWAEHDTFAVANPGDADFADKPKYYVLDMFPYPSGHGLHVF